MTELHGAVTNIIKDSARAVASLYNDTEFVELHALKRSDTDCRQCYLGGGLNRRTKWWMQEEDQAVWCWDNIDKACSMLGLDPEPLRVGDLSKLGTLEGDNWNTETTHPVIAILQRSKTCEEGHKIDLGSCKAVMMDEHERSLMDKAEQVTGYYYRDVLCLHAFHNFTHVCATDGSRKVEGELVEGTRKLVKKLAWGYFCNMKHAKAGRMPGTLEILDAELYAIFYFLKDEKSTDGQRNSVLVLSDCEAALKLLDSSRRLSKQHLLDVGRAELLHAILTLESEWDQVVYYWIASHKGITWNAYADAMAKWAVDLEKDQALIHLTQLDPNRNGGWPLRTFAFVESGDKLDLVVDRKRYKALCEKFNDTVVKRLEAGSEMTLMDSEYFRNNDPVESTYYTKLMAHCSNTTKVGSKMVDWVMKARSDRTGTTHDRAHQVLSGGEFQKFIADKGCAVCGNQQGGTATHALFGACPVREVIKERISVANDQWQAADRKQRHVIDDLTCEDEINRPWNVRQMQWLKVERWRRYNGQLLDGVAKTDRVWHWQSEMARWEKHLHTWNHTCDEIGVHTKLCCELLVGVDQPGTSGGGGSGGHAMRQLELLQDVMTGKCVCYRTRDDALLGAVSGTLHRPIEFASNEEHEHANTSAAAAESQFIKNYVEIVTGAMVLNNIWGELQRDQKAYWLDLYELRHIMKAFLNAKRNLDNVTRPGDKRPMEDPNTEGDSEEEEEETGPDGTQMTEASQKRLKRRKRTLNTAARSRPSHFRMGTANMINYLKRIEVRM